MTETKPIRITIDVYEKAKELMLSEQKRNTPMSRAFARTDTNWFSELVDRGMTAYLHDTKQDR